MKIRSGVPPADAATMVFSGHAPLNFSALLPEEFGASVLGTRAHAGLYERNPFRYLGLPASASREEVSRRSQRVRAFLNMSARQAFAHAVAVGYDTTIEAREVAKALALLEDPVGRMRHEIFWLHVHPGFIEKLQARGGLHLPEAWNDTERLATDAADSQGRALADHALAVVHHNSAIYAELEFSQRRTSWPGEAWQKAHHAWHAVQKDDRFWSYLGDRVAARNDPRLTATHLAELRGKLASLLLSVHGIFARHYALAGDAAAAARHLELIRSAPFTEANRQEVFRHGVGAVLAPRLAALERRFQGGRLARSEKISPKLFEPEIGPLLREYEIAAAWWRESMATFPDTTTAAEFDPLAKLIQDAIDQHLDYSGNDRCETILYGMALTRRLKACPVSARQLLDLNNHLFRDRESLLGSANPQGDFDPTDCWFLPGEPAVPETSLFSPYHRITRVKETSVSYATVNVVVPRSPRAREIHAHGLNTLFDWETARAAGRPWRWTPCAPTATAAFEVAGTWKATGLLELAELAHTKETAVLDHLKGGHFSAWLAGRGQYSIAGQCRRFEGAGATVAPFLAFLREAAHAEITGEKEAAAAVLDATFNAQCQEEIRQEQSRLERSLRDIDMELADAPLRRQAELAAQAEADRTTETNARTELVKLENDLADRVRLHHEELGPAQAEVDARIAAARARTAAEVATQRQLDETASAADAARLAEAAQIASTRISAANVSAHEAAAHLRRQVEATAHERERDLAARASGAAQAMKDLQARLDGRPLLTKLIELFSDTAQKAVAEETQRATQDREAAIRHWDQRQQRHQAEQREIEAGQTEAERAARDELAAVEQHVAATRTARTRHLASLEEAGDRAVAELKAQLECIGGDSRAKVQAAQELVRLQRAAIERLQANTESNARSIQRRIADQVSRLEASLTATRGQIAALTATAQKKYETLKRDRAREITEQEKARRLRWQKLFSARPEAQQNQCPTRVTAVAAGMQPGAEPSQAEVNRRIIMGA